MKKFGKKNLWQTALIAAVVVISATWGRKILNAETKDMAATIHNLGERAEIMNRDCPFVIDENTRLDSVTSPKADVLQNNYTLLQDSRDDIDVEAFQNIFKPEITLHLKATPQTSDFRKANATLVYKYFDRDKKHVTDIVLQPGEY